jgi:putative membrane protein insertion efficiency factor
MTNPASLALIGAVRAYQLFVSPLLGHNCRFLPSCSDYALDAVRRHGPVSGSWLAGKRLCRCHPWGGDGYDPVPPASSLSSR